MTFLFKMQNKAKMTFDMVENTICLCYNLYGYKKDMKRDTMPSDIALSWREERLVRVTENLFKK